MELRVSRDYKAHRESKEKMEYKEQKDSLSQGLRVPRDYRV
jgi:hypothetical protein